MSLKGKLWWCIISDKMSSRWRIMNDSSNTLKCFPALCTINSIFCWELYIVKKLVPTILLNGKNPFFSIKNDNIGGKRWGRMYRLWGLKPCEGIIPIIEHNWHFDKNKFFNTFFYKKVINNPHWHYDSKGYL